MGQVIKREKHDRGESLTIVNFEGRIVHSETWIEDSGIIIFDGEMFKNMDHVMEYIRRLF